jgi:uncharacterized protein (DUF2062 family)
MVYLKTVWVKLIALFKQGLTPRDLALSITVALLVVIFPFLGLDTIVLTAIAIPFRLNLPIMIAISYLAVPIKFALFIPLINIGSGIFGTERITITMEAIKASYDISILETFKSLSYELLYGFVGWISIAIPFGLIVYFVLKTIFIYIDKLKSNRGLNE